MDTKICTKCKIEKSIDDFYDHSKQRKQSHCKKCNHFARSKWAKNNKTAANLVARKSRFKILYNITENDYIMLLKEQKFLCKICNLEHSESKPLCVDHCHETGKIRGLICKSCNNAIGLLKHNITVIQNALNYLQ